MGGFVPISGPFGRVACCNPKGNLMPKPAHLMQPLANLMPCLPGLTALSGSMKTYAAWPVWSDSTTKEIQFQRMPKKIATRLWHKARDFDRRTHAPGKHGGAVGHGLIIPGRHTPRTGVYASIFRLLRYSLTTPMHTVYHPIPGPGQANPPASLSPARAI